ncbi:MAG: MBL fold metallo-hydrolase [Vicinamibacterales bacterium]
MRAKTLLASFGLAATVGVAVVTTQTPAPPTVEGLVSAAKASAGLEWPGTFLRLCVVPPPVVRRGGDAPASASAAVTGPPKNTWFAEPAKVADNLYFLGTKVHNSWALVGSDGIVIIEALFDYASPDEVIDGMRKLHLDTNKVKYVVMSHAHGDHDGGARFLQDKLSSGRLIYGAPDWDLAASQTRPGGAPKRDMDGTDGMVLSVGDTSIRIVTTPGHTAGTLSYLFEAKDNGRPLRFVYVGGTAIPFNEKAAWYDEYIASSRKLAKAAADFGATALISNHTEFDNGYYKAHTAAHRQPGESNPFEVGKDTVARYFTLIDQCTTAAKLRASSAAR